MAAYRPSPLRVRPRWANKDSPAQRPRRPERCLSLSRGRPQQLGRKHYALAYQGACEGTQTVV